MDTLMARAPQLILSEDLEVVFRAAAPELQTLRDLVFSRYPADEWASFIRCGWRAYSGGLVLTLAAVDAPAPGDMDDRVGNVSILEPYSRRIALLAQANPLAVGLVHSHPDGCRPCPSAIDDDMDAYYGEKYLRGFAPGRPFCSLIFSKQDDELVVSGRVWWQSRWHAITRVLLAGVPSRTWVNGRRPDSDGPIHSRTARLSSAFGLQAAARLRRASVAVIGAGGTGSAAIEVLARAGIGRLVIVDPDELEESNLERVHGSIPAHATSHMSKVVVAREHVQAIAPDCKVIALKGSLPQPGIVDAMLGVDAVLGCTDTQHGRVAMSDLAIRYLVPGLDVGVALEGEDGTVSAQVVQVRRFLPADSCPRCRKRLVQWRLNQELMSPKDRALRRDAAAAANERGEDPHAYWREEPQLNTVGYLTTLAGALAAGYVIGWLTDRFAPSFSTLEASLLVPSIAVVRHEAPDADCSCQAGRGWADQAAHLAQVSAPSHWPEPVRL